MAASLMPLPKQHYTGVAGIPLVGGKVYTYAAGTTTPKQTFSDSAGTVPQTNPIILNSRGEPANAIYWSGNYKIEIRDSLDNLIYSVDNYNTDPAGVWSILTQLAASNGSALIGFIQNSVGAVARTVMDVLLDRTSIFNFMTAAQIADVRSRTASLDLTAAIQAAINASNGRRLYIPSGKYKHAELTVPKNVLLHLDGEFDSYNNTEGTVFLYSGTGIGLQIGVDDGNPDVTGPARGSKISGIHFATTNGQTAVRAQNTALFEMTNCRTRSFAGKIIDLRANVITKIRDNDIAGSQPASGNYGIWCDDEYFGNFVTDICDNHIFQVNHAGRFSEGRSLTVHNNTVENIRPGATGGVWKFETAGYISTVSFRDNYYENHQGYLYEGAGFTGAILNFEARGEEGWGSTDAGNVNPGVGNLPRTKVFAQDIDGNFYVDSEWNAKAFLALPSVYPITSIFDQATTIIRSQVTGEDYEKELVYQLQLAEILLSSGDFSMVSGATTTTATGGALALTGASATPFGWTNLAVPQWQLIPEAISGGWCCFVPNTAADFDRCQRAITLTPIARARYFAIVFTTKGWSALRVDGIPVYDSGANVANWHTEVVRFSVASSSSGFTLKFGTNANNPFYIGEARLFEIGAAEFTEPGSMNNALIKAVKRLMKRGVY